MAMWRITQEPKGEVYTNLLKLATTRCTSFSLRREIGRGLGETEQRIEKLLEPYRLEDEVTHQKWDAIRKELFAGLGDISIMQKYKLTAETLDILVRADGLYSWQNPEMPEDLCFHLTDGDIWLHSDVRGKNSWIDEAELGLESLLKSVPGLCVEEW